MIDFGTFYLDFKKSKDEGWMSIMKVNYLFILSLTIGTTLVLLHCPNRSDDPDTATVSPGWVGQDTWNM